MVYACKTYFDCVEAAAQSVAKLEPDLNSPVLVVCEDKLTLSLETAICEKTGGTFTAEVCSLGRYVQKRLPQTISLSKEGAAMTVKKILTALAPSLEVLGRISSSPSLAGETSELIAQLKSAKINPDELYDATNELSNRSSAKIRDVARIFKAYEEYLSVNGLTDSNDALAAVVEAVEKDPSISRTKVIFTGLSSLTKQTADAVKKFVKSAASVDFFVVKGDNTDLYTNEFYNFCKNFCDTPIEIASNATKDGVRILDKLFDPSVYAEEGKPTDSVFCFEAEDLSDEAEFIAARIRYEIIEKGYRYKDIAIGVGNAEEYSLVLPSKLEEYGIPYYSDEKRPLSSLPIAKLVDSLLKAARGTGLREIKDVLSSTLFISDRSISDSIIRRLTYESVTYKAFLAEKFSMGDLLCDAKISLLVNFLKSTPRKDLAKVYVAKIRKFLTDCGASENAAACAHSLESYDALDEKALLSAEENDFNSILDEIESVIGDEPLTVDEFRRILLAGEESCKTTILSERYDSVYIGELKDCRYKQYEILFAVGLNGDVPSVKGDAALLMDGDIADLEKLSLSIEPKIRVVNDREREATGVALASFRDELILSRPLLSSSGVPSSKSRIVEYAEKLFGSKTRKFTTFSRSDLNLNKVKIDGEKGDKLRAFDFIAPRPAIFSFVKKSDDFKEGATDDLCDISSYYAALDRDGEAYAKISAALSTPDKNERKNLPTSNYFNENRVSASVLECFYSCPYKCYARYCLGAKDSVSGEAKSLDYGNVLHAVAERFISDVESIKSEEQARDKAKRIIEEQLASPEYERFLKRPEYAYSFKLLDTEASNLCARLYREYELSDFKPDGQEVWFADWADVKALPLDTERGDFKLFGKTDRVDRYGDYVRIIDYKTGHADEKIKDKRFYTGQNVQLYLYMNAFARNGLKPAGAYYYALDDDYLKDGNSRVSMHGKTLKDEAIIRATDSSFYDEKKSEIISGSIKSYKKGDTLVGTSFAEQNVLEAYMRYAKILAEKAVDCICDGVNTPSPYESACTYCEFGSSCGFDENVDRIRSINDKITSASIVDAVKYEDSKKGDA